MTTNVKPAKANKAVTMPTSVRATKPVDQEVIAVARENAVSIAKVYSAMQADEASRDAEIDKMETELEEHLEKLERNGVSDQDIEAIRTKAEARINKKRQYNLEHKKENTKRWNSMLWILTFNVLGFAVIKYGPDILNEWMKYRKCY